MCVPFGQYGNTQELLEGNWFGECQKVPPNELNVKYGYKSIVIQQYVFESAMMALLEDPFDIFSKVTVLTSLPRWFFISSTTPKVTTRIQT